MNIIELLKFNRYLSSSIFLVVLAFAVLFLKTSDLDVTIYAEKAQLKKFLLNVETLSTGKNKLNVAVITRQMLTAGKTEAISLSNLPDNTTKLTLWIVHPEYRYSRVVVPVPSMFGGVDEIRIAPISWQNAIANGVADYDEVMAQGVVDLVIVVVDPTNAASSSMETKGGDVMLFLPANAKVTVEARIRLRD